MAMVVRWNRRYGSAGHWPPIGISQAIGELVLPNALQHLNPDLQSVSAMQGTPKPPLPGIQEVPPAVSIPFAAAVHALG